MATKLGTAYVDVRPDLSSLSSALGSAFAGGKLSGAAKAAGGIAAIGTAAAVAGKALVDVGQEFDDAYDSIKVRTGAAGKDMAKLKDAFRDVVSSVPVDFAEAADAVGMLGQRLDIGGKNLARLSKQMTALSKVTGSDLKENVESTARLFGDWSVKTKDQSDRLDELFRLTHATGIEFSDLNRLMVQFGSPLRQLGFDFEEAAAMFSRFEREGVNMETLLPGLRFALKNISLPTQDLAKQFKQLGVDTKSPHDALMQIFDLLSGDKMKAADETMLASSVFGGRAWADMKAAIEEGRFEFDDLIKTMKDGDATIRGTERGTRDMAEHWKILGNRLKVLVEPVAKDVFRALSNLVKALSKVDFGAAIESLKKFWREAGVFRDVVGAVASFVKDRFGAIVDFAKGAVKLVGGILKGDFGQIWEAVKDIFKAGVKGAIAPFKAMFGLVKAIGGRIGDALGDAFSAAWDKVKGIFSGGLDVVLTVVNAVLDVVEEIPGVGDLGPISNPLGGGTETGNAGASGAEGGNTTGGGGGGGGGGGNQGGNNKRSTTIPSRLGQHYVGGKIQTPTAIVGEEAPAHPEYVIATNPAYRDRNKKLWAAAGHEIGIPGFQGGGVIGSGPIGGGLAMLKGGAGALIDKLPDTSKIPDVFGNLGGWIIDKATGFIKDKVSNLAESAAGAVTSGMIGQGPDGIGTYGGLPMANWVIMALRYAAQKGASPQPTSGYRSHAYNVAQGRTYYSEHEGTAYPHGAVDFGGYTTGLAEKMSVVNATRDFAMPLLAPIGFVDDGHASGTGHRRGGILGRMAGHALEFFGRGGQRGKGAGFGFGSMSHLNVDQLTTLASLVGMRDPAIMGAIAMGESSGNPRIIGDGGDSVGLWQINTPSWPQFSYEKLKGPLYNARAAKVVLDNQGLTAWTIYNTGAYRNHLGGQVLTAPSNGGGGGGGGGNQGGGGGGNGNGDEGNPGALDDPTSGPFAQAFLAREDRERAARQALREQEWFPVRKALPGALGRKIESLDEARLGAPDFIADLETKFGMPLSEAGREFGPLENENLILWNTWFLKLMTDERDAIDKAYRKVGIDSRAGKFLSVIMEELTGTVLGGDGGAILQQRAVLEDLLHPEAGATAAELAAQQEQLLTLTQTQLDTALANARILAGQAPVFAEMFRRVPFGGSFATGGVVPGAPGQPVGIVAHGGETVVPEGGMNVTVVVEDGAVKPEAIRVVVNDRLAEVARASSPVGGSAGQRVRR